MPRLKQDWRGFSCRWVRTLATALHLLELDLSKKAMVWLSVTSSIRESPAFTKTLVEQLRVIDIIVRFSAGPATATTGLTSNSSAGKQTARRWAHGLSSY